MARPAPEPAAPLVVWRGDADERHPLAVVNAGLIRALEAAGHEVRRAAPGDAALPLPAVGVAQQRPPRFEPPTDGPFVLFQPWELGRVPSAWVERIRAGVDEVWTPSQSAREAFVLSGVPRERVRVVPAGVDLERFTPDGPRRPIATDRGTVLLFLGGTPRHDGLDLLLEAYGQAFRAEDDVCLVLVGFGEDEIAAFRAVAGAPEVVLLADEVPHGELPALYRAADAVVQPYRAAASCLPALEAMACGRPVIVPSGGPADDVVSEACAWLLPVRREPVREDALGEELRLPEPGFTLEPDVPALVAALREAARPGARAAKAATARSHAERFSWDAAARAAAARLAALAGRTPVRHAAAPIGADGHERVELILRRAADAAREGRADAVREAFAAAAALGDRDRAYQARRHLAEVVLAAPARPEARPALLAAAAEGLLKALEAAPAEPVLLHLLGALLDELGDADSAEAAWGAALRLDPDVPGLRECLRALFAREQAAPAWTLGASHPLAERVQTVAAAARPAEDQTLSLCMIVKDEEEMLPGCLAPVRPFVDEIIVVDTGSTDRTVEIAESFGARVLHFPWNGSFADARNVSLEAATGDWVMYLDADEHLVAEDGPLLRDLLGRTWREGFELVETNYTGAPGSGQAVTHMALRLWRHRPEHRFEGCIHEQKTGRMPTYLGERFEATEIRVNHYGYLKSRVADKDKSRRNLELLEREAGERPTPFTSFNLGSEYLLTGDHAGARRHLDEAWEAVRRQPEWSELGYAPMLVSRVAAARREVGDLAAAREAAREGLEAYPSFTDLVLELALCARAAGDDAAAEAIAHRCLELGDAPARLAPTVGSGSFLALCLLAEIAAVAGRTEEAEALYRRSLADHPEFVGPSLPLAGLMIARGARPEELAAAIPADPPSAALLAATACLEAGETGAAELLFRAVLERQQDSVPAAVGLVEAMLSERRYAEAADAAAGPADSPARLILAGHRLFAHAAGGDAPGLAGALPGAAGAGVPEADLALYRAWGDALAGAAGDPGPLPAEALLTAATALEALLRVQEFEAFELLHGLYGRIAADPRERRERLAGAYLRRGFLESAADEWMAVLAEAPDAAALVGLAQVALAQGWHEDAAALGRQALELEPGNDAAERLVAAAEPAPVGA